MSLSISLPTILATSDRVYRNLTPARLIEVAVSAGEGVLTAQGALCCATGKYTGRSPKDKFIVREAAVADQIDWGPVNQPMAPEVFERLHRKMLDYIDGKDLYVFDGFGGADPRFRLPIRVVNEFAWQNLFIQHLLIRPSADELAAHEPEFTILCMPGCSADPAVDGTNSEAFVVVSFEQRLVLIGGTHYAGEMKKSVFTLLNYLLPFSGVLPMHCGANVGEQGDVALFFGLSGTGKTTLSADPQRRLIGDDEHGWSDNGIFNFEGGAYAKCINLSAENEPQIWNAIRFGTVLENVVVEPETREPDYDSDELTENTRAAYPIEYMPGAVLRGVAEHPGVILFLAADASGVLPPIARLTPEQAMYHFLSGYTSKLAGTERGVTAPEATFSACFGGPFLPLPASTYAKQLGERIARHQARVYLVNTGWSGGPYGVGERMNLRYTRAMVRAAISGELEQAEFVPDPIFKVQVPTTCPGVPSDLLQPRKAWADEAEYDRYARELASLFAKNFGKFKGVPAEVAEAGPRAD